MGGALRDDVRSAAPGGESGPSFGGQSTDKWTRMLLSLPLSRKVGSPAAYGDFVTQVGG
jgi:hypothetical protein